MPLTWFGPCIRGYGTAAGRKINELALVFLLVLPHEAALDAEGKAFMASLIGQYARQQAGGTAWR